MAITIIDSYSKIFSPTTFNPMFWYDMGDVDTVYSDAGSTKLTGTAALYQINDKSDNGHHLSQSASGQQPTWNSGGYIDFDGAGDHISTNDGDNSGDAQSDRGTAFSTCAMTIFMVVAADDWDGTDDTDVSSDSNDDYILGGQANNHNLVRFDSKDAWSVKLCDTSSSADVTANTHNHNFLVANGKVIVTIRVTSSAEVFIYKGESTPAGSDTANSTDKKFHWGTLGSAGAVGATNTYNGKVYEVIGYESDLGAPAAAGTNRASMVYNMLVTKHGL